LVEVMSAKRVSGIWRSTTNFVKATGRRVSFAMTSSDSVGGRLRFG
jgi:hypothetical protein